MAESLTPSKTVRTCKARHQPSKECGLTQRGVVQLRVENTVTRRPVGEDCVALFFLWKLM